MTSSFEVVDEFGTIDPQAVYQVLTQRQVERDMEAYYLAHLVRVWLNSPRPCLRSQLLQGTVLGQSFVY